MCARAHPDSGEIVPIWHDSARNPGLQGFMGLWLRPRAFLRAGGSVGEVFAREHT